LLGAACAQTDKEKTMSSVAVELDEAVANLLRRSDRPIDQAAQELIVVELYRRHELSSGRAAELLGMRLIDFIQHTSRLGIPFFDMTDEEWEREREAAHCLFGDLARPASQ
jgi:predicted HTH domain antitoxin